MEHHAADSAAHADHGYGHATSGHYVKVWGILLVLLCVSVAGPFLGIKIVTLITAFGIALVKAYLVAKNFMHLNVQRPFVIFLLVTALALMVLFFGAVSPDVMKHEGRNWTNDAARRSVEHGLAAGSEHGQEHGVAPAGGHAAEPAGER